MGLIVYALVVYFVYHLVAKSDLLAAPRGWALRVLPSWLMYPAECPYCFTFWVTTLLTLVEWWARGMLHIRLDLLMAAPVVNYLIGLAAERMSRPMLIVAGTEPPLLGGNR